jgi:CheY-like chemotaxis protein
MIHRRMTILIVENNRQMRRMIRTVIASFATRVEELENGADAAAAYDACRPDWVLMDIRLPGLDGIAAVREIRRLDPEARVVMVTNYDDDELRRAARQAGACAYVLKDNLLRLRQLLTTNS